MTGLEVLEKVKTTIKNEMCELDLQGFKDSGCYRDFEKSLNDLLVIEKSLKALEIIKQIITKTEDTLQDILRCKDYEEYKGLWYFQTSLTQEEFDLLKEVLE